MFQPLKTKRDLICEHCGEIIPTGTYFEFFNNEYYHIECLWDNVYNNMALNSYAEARAYFLNLQNKVGHWDYYGLDTEETYLSDLELVKHNNRVIGV